MPVARGSGKAIVREVWAGLEGMCKRRFVPCVHFARGWLVGGIVLVDGSGRIGARVTSRELPLRGGILGQDMPDAA